MKAAVPEDIRGFQISCPEYYKCPVCYGCRNFNMNYLECQNCRQHGVKSVCDLNKHRTDLLEKLYKERAVIRI